MANFENEVGIDGEAIVSQSKSPSLVIIKSQFPFFVLPLCLVCILLCLHAGINDFQQYRMSKEITVVDKRASLALERTHLLGIVHNENFARVSKAVGIDPVYIGEDWKINQMPRHLRLTPEAYQYLWFKYYGEPPVTPANFRADCFPNHHPVAHASHCHHACERTCVRRCLLGRCLRAAGRVLKWVAVGL